MRDRSLGRSSWLGGLLALLLVLGAARPVAAGVHTWTPIGPELTSKVLSLVIAPSDPAV